MSDTANGATSAIGAAAKAGGTSVVAHVRVHDLVNDPGIGKAWHFVDDTLALFLLEWNEEV